MTTLFTCNLALVTRPELGEAATRMYHGIEWELLSRSPNRRP
jgi:hypothetical protein